MSYSDIVATIALFISITAVPVSGYLSYRYAIKGEKRKEFNGVTEPLRHKFREQLRLLDENLYPAGGTLEVTESEIDALIDVSPKRQQKRISQAWKLYKQSLMNSGSFDEYNDYKMHDAESVKITISRLMSLIVRH